MPASSIAAIPLSPSPLACPRSRAIIPAYLKSKITTITKERNGKMGKMEKKDSKELNNVPPSPFFLFNSQH